SVGITVPDVEIQARGLADHELAVHFESLSAALDPAPRFGVRDLRRVDADVPDLLQPRSDADVDRVAVDDPDYAALHFVVTTEIVPSPAFTSTAFPTRHAVPLP